MIARTFHARSSSEGARAYAEFFRGTLIPQLERIEGHRGALVLTRENGGSSEITVVTFWSSMEAVIRFAGDPPDRAVIEPEARALFEWFDDRVTHQEVAICTVRSG